MVTTMMLPRTATRNTAAMANVGAMCGQMIRHMTKLKMRFSGARTAMRVHIMYAPLDVGDVRRHAGDKPGDGELVDVGEGKGLYVVIYGLSQVGREAGGRLGGETAGQGAEAQRYDGHGDHQYAVAHDDGKVGRLQAVVDDDGGDEGHEYLQQHLAAVRPMVIKASFAVFSRLFQNEFQSFYPSRLLSSGDERFFSIFFCRRQKVDDLVLRKAAEELARQVLEHGVHHVSHVLALFRHAQELAPLVERAGLHADEALFPAGA